MDSYITSASISPTGLYMAFGDAAGAIHLMTAGGDDEPGMNLTILYIMSIIFNYFL